MALYVAPLFLNSKHTHTSKHYVDSRSVNHFGPNSEVLGGDTAVPTATWLFRFFLEEEDTLGTLVCWMSFDKGRSCLTAVVSLCFSLIPM